MVPSAKKAGRAAGHSAPPGDLPPPADYFPPASGRYQLWPGLHALGTDFGNGPADRRLFQLDSLFPRYRAAKLEARRECLDKYVRTHRFHVETEAAVCRFLCRQLHEEWPRWFALDRGPEGAALDCGLTGETLYFDRAWRWRGANPAGGPVHPPYVSGWDALGCQLQEDLALVSLDAQGGNHVSALHLCYPNHWAAEDKIGRDFALIHEPVAGIAPINRNADRIVQAMVHKGPFVRFAWGLATDTRLNHHPDPPPGRRPDRWRGRRFGAGDSGLYLRTERQCIRGLPEAASALFTIRTYFKDCRKIKADETKRSALLSAIESMGDDSLEYKGLAGQKKKIVAWLRAD